ncbi:MAG: extracellular matrix regulator RemB [Eubacteriales bacterium]
MFIHIGAGSVVRGEAVIGFFDMDGKWDSEVTKDFLKRVEKDGRTCSAGSDLPRSFVLTDDRLIFTHISTSALKSRAEGGE